MARILIVDDEENIINSMTPILQDEGHVVFSGKTGEEAISFLRKNEVDLIILDGAGQEVYSASKQEGEANLSWDGTDSKGKTMADGTYYYLLKITVQSNGQVFRRKGFIVLKRN